MVAVVVVCLGTVEEGSPEESLEVMGICGCGLLLVALVKVGVGCVLLVKTGVGGFLVVWLVGCRVLFLAWLLMVVGLF